MKVLFVQSCLTLCNPMDSILPGTSIHGILQARILEWVAIPLLQGIFLTQGSNSQCLLCLLHCKQIRYCWATRLVPKLWWGRGELISRTCELLSSLILPPIHSIISFLLKLISIIFVHCFFVFPLLLPFTAFQPHYLPSFLDPWQKFLHLCLASPTQDHAMHDGPDYSA